jgi:hypothetical protein
MLLMGGPFNLENKLILIFPWYWTCDVWCKIKNLCIIIRHDQGRIQDFKLGVAHLKKLRRAEGGAKIFGVFRVKNHDFTPKNHIFSNCGGRHEHFWGISFEKSRFYAKKSYFFPILGGARAGCAPPPPNPPLMI